VTLYLIRHGHAGSRQKWHGPDDERPLSAKGEAQAQGIAAWLEGADIARVLSSPSLRCRQTVEPLADRLDLRVEADEALCEGTSVDEGIALLGRLVNDHAALCSHGDVLPEVVQALRSAGLQFDGHMASAKGGTFVIETVDGRFTTCSYVPPPEVSTGTGTRSDPGQA